MQRLSLRRRESCPDHRPGGLRLRVRGRKSHAISGRFSHAPGMVQQLSGLERCGVLFIFQENLTLKTIYESLTWHEVQVTAHAAAQHIPLKYGEAGTSVILRPLPTATHFA